MSALSPSATWQIVSPVAGLMAAKVLPETLSTNLPPMNSGWSLTLGGLTARGLLGVVVAMGRPPEGDTGRRERAGRQAPVPAGETGRGSSGGGRGRPGGGNAEAGRRCWPEEGPCRRTPTRRRGKGRLKPAEP